MKKRIISFLLVICLVAALIPMSALAASEGTVGNPWSSGTAKAYIDGSVLHIYGNGEMADYTSTSDTTPWSKYASKITGVVIEEDVQKIGNEAFTFCKNLTALTLRRDADDTTVLKLGSNAIPSGVSVRVEITGSTGAEYNSDQPWANLKTRIVSVDVQEGVTKLGAQAFSGCVSIQSVTIPSTVSEIGREAFANCIALTDVTIKHDYASGLTIGADAFPTANSGFKVAMEITGSTAVPSFAAKEDQPWAQFRTYIRTLTVGGNVPGIGNNAFSGCTGLTGVTLYFQQGSGEYTEKVLGLNWLRESDTIPITLQAVAGDKAFLYWDGATFANYKSSDTYMSYDYRGGNIKAYWGSKASGIAFEPDDAEHVFPELDLGYSAIAPYALTVKNSGNQITGKLLVELSGGNNDCFDLSTRYLDSLGVGVSGSFSVAPKSGLEVGEYATTVVVSNDNGDIVDSIRVSFVCSTKLIRAQRFVKHLYATLLGRGATDAEIKTWTDKIIDGGATGAQVAASFCASDEFRSKCLSNEDFVKTLYLALFNRTVDSSGLATWTKALNGGKTRSWLFVQLCSNQEYINFCNSCTVTPGTIKAESYDMSNKENLSLVYTNAATAFVQRLYSVVLGRAADATGLKTWTDQILTHKMSGAQVAASLFASDEYRGKNKSNNDFITDLYNALLDRGVDGSGLATWSGYLNGGQSRAWVFQHICESDEFKSICGIYITPGTIDPSKYAMGNATAASDGGKVEQAKAEALVQALYQAILGRAADAAGLASWTKQIVDNNMGGAVVAINLFNSAEYRGKKTTDAEFVTDLYEALLGRSVDATGLATWTNELGGRTRASVLKSLSQSGECTTYLATFGIKAGTINDTQWKLA